MMNSEEAKQNSKENKSKSEEISNAKNVLNGQIRLLGKLFDLDIEAFEETSCDDFENTKERVAKDTIIHNVDIIADDVNSVRIRTLASASIK